MRLGEPAVATVAARKSYAVRHAGSPSRLGKVWKVYPFSLRSLEEALQDARLRSLYDGPHVLTVVEGRQSRVIRRFEHGRQVPGIGSRK
jgi:hypothetical protein